MENKKDSCGYDPLKDSKLLMIEKDNLERLEILESKKKFIENASLDQVDEHREQSLIEYQSKSKCSKEKEEKQKLIDVFAGQVLQGMTAGFYSMDYAHGWKPQDIAVECYDIAEAMYEERRKRNG